MNTTKRGFTLIELLVVIAIVAVLAVTVILTLNPAQLLKQARDSTRSSDLATLKSAISVYLADYPSASLATSSANCYVHVSSSLGACNTGGRFSSAGTVLSTSSLAVNGTGWIPVNFNAISSGSPISVLPDDPVNNATNFYAYRADTTNLTFEINAKMESAKFISGGPNDMETNDGGNNTGLFEVGSAPGLAL